MEKIVLDQVTFSVNDVKIIDGITLTIPKGDSLVLFGNSGSGKSIFLKLCAGLYIPTEGKVWINGVDIHQVKRRKKLSLMKQIGFLFQDGALITNINVFENIALPLRYHKLGNKKEIDEKVEEKLNELDISNIKLNMPGSLSPGQIRLVGLARETIAKPEILFFDDPTTGMDGYNIRKLIALIKKHIEEGGTAITVTQNQEFAEAIVNRMAVIDKGQLIACGDPKSVRQSENDTVKQVFRSLSAEKDLADEVLKMMDDEFF